MSEKRTIPSDPRFDFVRDQAYRLLLEMGFSKFPVSPWDIINEYDENIFCLSWSKARIAWGEDDPFHLSQLKADARVIRKGSIYLIVYDDVGISNSKGTAPSEERIRWSLMHELGHIFLLHLKQFDATRLDRGGVSDEEYRVLEIEAHQFAAEMYIPTSIFKFLDGVTVNDLRVLCDISKQAAQKRHKTLYESSYTPDSIRDNALLRNFNDFLEGEFQEALYKGIIKRWGKRDYKQLLNISRKCPSCHSFSTDPETQYCPHCGYELGSHLRGLTSTEQLKIENSLANSFSKFHRQIWTNDGKLITCPVCQNHQISPQDQFCSICGQPLVNKCINEDKIISSSYQFCPDCGAEATFNQGYIQLEKRISAISVFSEQHKSDEWLEYSYWRFIQRRIAAQDPLLHSILFCSKAYITENDYLLVYTDNIEDLFYIQVHENIILTTIKNNDTTQINGLEVRLTHDL